MKTDLLALTLANVAENYARILEGLASFATHPEETPIEDPEAFERTIREDIEQVSGTLLDLMEAPGFDEVIGTTRDNGGKLLTQIESSMSSAPKLAITLARVLWRKPVED